MNYSIIIDGAVFQEKVSREFAVSFCEKWNAMNGGGAGFCEAGKEAEYIAANPFVERPPDNDDPPDLSNLSPARSPVKKKRPPSKPREAMPVNVGSVPKDATLRQFFDTVFSPARLATRSQHTRGMYDLNLRRLDLYLGRQALLSDLSDSTINAAVAWMKENGGSHRPQLSPGSVHKFADCICSIWRYANHIRLVDTYPSIPAVVVPKRIPRAWTREELERLWQTIARLPGQVCGIPTSLYFLSLHQVLWCTGGRISETVSAEWPQIDFVGGFFLVPAEKRKGGAADKLSKLNTVALGLLRQILLPERKLIWPIPRRNYTWFWHAEKKILESAGLPFVGRHFSYHTMRRSVASHVRACGGDAQRALGHLDARMTEENYIDPRVSGAEFASDVLFQPGSFFKELPKLESEPESNPEPESDPGSESEHDE